MVSDSTDLSASQQSIKDLLEIEQQALNAYEQSWATVRKAQRKANRLYKTYLAAVEARGKAERLESSNTDGWTGDPNMIAHLNKTGSLAEAKELLKTDSVPDNSDGFL